MDLLPTLFVVAFSLLLTKSSDSALCMNNLKERPRRNCMISEYRRKYDLMDPPTFQKSASGNNHLFKKYVIMEHGFSVESSPKIEVIKKLHPKWHDKPKRHTDSDRILCYFSSSDCNLRNINKSVRGSTFKENDDSLTYSSNGLRRPGKRVINKILSFKNEETHVGDINMVKMVEDPLMDFFIEEPPTLLLRSDPMFPTSTSTAGLSNLRFSTKTVLKNLWTVKQNILHNYGQKYFPDSSKEDSATLPTLLQMAAYSKSPWTRFSKLFSKNKKKYEKHNNFTYLGHYPRLYKHYPFRFPFGSQEKTTPNVIESKTTSPLMQTTISVKNNINLIKDTELSHTTVIFRGPSINITVSKELPNYNTINKLNFFNKVTPKMNPESLSTSAKCNYFYNKSIMADESILHPIKNGNAITKNLIDRKLINYVKSNDSLLSINSIKKPKIIQTPLNYMSKQVNQRLKVIGPSIHAPETRIKLPINIETQSNSAILNCTFLRNLSSLSSNHSFSINSPLPFCKHSVTNLHKLKNTYVNQKGYPVKYSILDVTTKKDAISSQPKQNHNNYLNSKFSVIPHNLYRPSQTQYNVPHNGRGLKELTNLINLSPQKIKEIMYVNKTLTNTPVDAPKLYSSKNFTILLSNIESNNTNKSNFHNVGNIFVEHLNKSLKALGDNSTIDIVEKKTMSYKPFVGSNYVDQTSNKIDSFKANNKSSSNLEQVKSDDYVSDHLNVLTLVSDINETVIPIQEVLPKQPLTTKRAVKFKKYFNLNTNNSNLLSIIEPNNSVNIKTNVDTEFTEHAHKSVNQTENIIAIEPVNLSKVEILPSDNPMLSESNGPNSTEVYLNPKFVTPKTLSTQSFILIVAPLTTSEPSNDTATSTVVNRLTTQPALNISEEYTRRPDSTLFRRIKIAAEVPDNLTNTSKFDNTTLKYK